MADPIETLKKEHRVIEEVLASLAIFAQRLDVNSDLDRRTAAEFAEFFQSFADRCHHGKEEDLLFVQLERQGMPSHTGPIGVMRDEHERGRRCVREINSIGRGNGPLTQKEGDGLREAISEFVPLLRAHIQKEDGVLFPMAENLLSSDVRDRLGEQFEKFEQDHMGNGVHEKMHDLAVSLVNRYRG